MITDIGSLVGDLTAHRESSARRAEKRASLPEKSLEVELDMLVDQVLDEDIDEKLIECLIDEATSSDPPDVDYDGDWTDAFSEARLDAIDALIASVDTDTSPAVPCLVMAFAWDLLDMTKESEFLAIFERARAQVHAHHEADVRGRADWPAPCDAT
ncbi:hypothetical protein [Cryobacterium sp. TMT2-23]|uniref:hypothetical protein n=1 Tax=Cryobacterium sp. TMT2-23 TaxID=1259252 RepID=UPI00106BC16A|nr:hypothetical protein [Cryobacterium sp. TMT2-23]TFD23814.1 hypothetical protein E3T32_05030 [Cryobacterium sp. TMT2-23]